MGMDVYIEGTLTIPAAKVLEAGKLFLEAIADRGGKVKVKVEDLDPRYAEHVKTPEGFVKLLENKLDSIGVVLENSGDVSFGCEDTTRREENDQWIFSDLSSVFNDGEFNMSGDGYHWKWVIADGKFSEHDSETVYDHDAKAVPFVDKLVEIIYPNGSPIGSPGNELGLGEYEQVIERIENLLRETGYGPQVGMDELDRLAAL